MQYIPPPPPPPPKKKSRWWVWLLVGIAVAIVLGAIGETTAETPSTVPSLELSQDTSMEVLRVAWDLELTETERTSICDYYNTPPVGTTPEMVRIFADGAEIPYAEAERLLDQLLAEEC